MLRVIDGCRIHLAGVEPISQLWNLLHRCGIQLVVMEDSSSLSNRLCCYWIFVIVESASPTLNLSCCRRSCVIEPGCDIVVLFRCLLLWPSVRYKAGQWDGRNEGAKTSHDKRRGLCFFDALRGSW